MTRRIPNTDLNLVISAAGTIVLLPLAIAQGLTLPDNAATGAIILYFGLAGTVAFGLQLGGLRRVTATETAVAAVLEPLVAAVLAAVLFDERLGVVAIVGGILMLGSIAALFSPKAARDGSTSTPGDRSVAP